MIVQILIWFTVEGPMFFCVLVEIVALISSSAQPLTTSCLIAIINCKKLFEYIGMNYKLHYNRSNSLNNVILNIYLQVLICVTFQKIQIVFDTQERN